MIKKRYKMFDVGAPYLTRCGVKSDDDYFENMTECCEEMNRLSEENEQLKSQTEMLKEILKRDRLLKNYKEKISYLKVRDCLIGAHVLGAQFDDLNKETEELLSSEVWEG